MRLSFKSSNGYRQGLIAEALATVWMCLKGYRILARRYRTPVGEIDIVARRGKVLCFVEVKHRKTKEAAIQAIHGQNQSRVSRAAALYLQRHPDYNRLTVRFDAIILYPGAWPRHVPHAWE